MDVPPGSREEMYVALDSALNASDDMLNHMAVQRAGWRTRDYAVCCR